ncbi:FRG domain-containing protein [Salinibacterium sp. NK8237]|uniref:FRG domain-containing protein n=1 Tax=Salinibacterium sp. NK8237 TaxID=2792038 RepID=UPI0018CE775F|nr:FRG domain-containing protein [Salinibacterium sp. NK8237]MBH0130557.1 FRG domain-containing protein [Salinibacterium sp. NK8237]
MAVNTQPWAPQSYFRAWERTIDSWDSLVSEIDHGKAISGNRKLVWRGVHNDSYGLLSSAYRRLKDLDREVPPEPRMRQLETELIGAARSLWPDRGGSALETLAHIQHYGGPTRLIDVSHDPMVAVFFATEKKFDSRTHLPLKDRDGRLFAFQADDRMIELDNMWGTRQLPWLQGEESIPGWETDLPFVWDPPRALNERISAQSGAFLVGGVPAFPHGQNSRYRMPGAWQTGAMKTMPVGEVRQVSSVSVFLKSLNRVTQAGSQAAYTWRIAAGAKEEIRQKLHSEYELNHGSIYPDLFGLATYAADFAALT